MFTLKNFAQSNLSAQLLVGGTSLTITSTEGVLFPDVGATKIFRGVIWGASFTTPFEDKDREIVEAYQSATDTFTIIRAQEETTAKQWDAGSFFMLTATAGTFKEYETAIYGGAVNSATEKTTPVDADLVGFIDSVSGLLNKVTWANIKATLKTYFDSLATTLTNKTLTSPVINTPTGSGFPVGEVSIFAGASAPIGFLLCNGASINRAGTYAALFAVIGTTYGSVDANTFNVPNIKGRSIVGVDAAQTEFDVLGKTGGAKTHTLTVAQLAAHKHTLPVCYPFTSGATLPMLPYNNNGTIYIYENTSTVGSGEAHNNLSPYISMNYIIRF